VGTGDWGRYPNNERLRGFGRSIVATTDRLFI
jgi:hypothetical protein